MRNKGIWLRIVIGLLFLAVYVASLVKNAGEQRRRSLELKDDVAAADHVDVSITVTGADPATRRLTARIRLRLAGNIAKDAVTPKVPLRLHVNNSPGQQLFEFPKGTRMTRIEATFPLEGEPDKYPFDRYDSNLGLSITTARTSNQPPAPQVRQDQSPVKPSDSGDIADLVLGESELERNVQVPLSISVAASTPGIKYTGKVIRSEDSGITTVHLDLRRSGNLINISVIVMCLMMGLAIGVLTMVLKGITSRESFETLPLSLCITLIFGLPALRNMQPGVPPIGVLGDYFSFIWAELFVATAGIIMAFTWVMRKSPGSFSKPGDGAHTPLK